MIGVVIFVVCRVWINDRLFSFGNIWFMIIMLYDVDIVCVSVFCLLLIWLMVWFFLDNFLIIYCVVVMLFLMMSNFIFNFVLISVDYLGLIDGNFIRVEVKFNKIVI